ncbi:MAG: HEAT repeat domain-containing protein [Microcystaceae cyanobacterium]
MKTHPLALEQEAQNEDTSPERLAELAQMSDSLAYLVAQNVNTSPETLRQLKVSKNQEIIRSIVRNPNTPTELLIELGSDFPDELGKNPILDLWLLEEHHPLLSNSSRKIESQLKRLASNRNTPVSLLKILANNSNKYVRSKIAKNPNTPISALEILAQDSNEYVRRTLLQYSFRKIMPFNVLAILAKDSETEIRRLVAARPQTPVTVSLLEMLAKDSDAKVRREVADNSHTPISLLEMLTKDSAYQVRNSASANLEKRQTQPQSND